MSDTSENPISFLIDSSFPGLRKTNEGFEIDGDISSDLDIHVKLPGPLLVNGKISSKSKIHSDNNLSATGNIHAGTGIRVEGSLYSGENIHAGKLGIRSRHSLKTPGSIESDGDIRAGWHISVGKDLLSRTGHIHGGDDVIVSGRMDAGEFIFCGGRLHVSEDIRSEGGIDVSYDILSGGNIHTGFGINAGQSIRCTGTLSFTKNLFAGISTHIPYAADDAVVECRDLAGGGTIRSWQLFLRQPELPPTITPPAKSGLSLSDITRWADKHLLEAVLGKQIMESGGIILREAAHMTATELMRRAGLSEADAECILAAIELGRRATKSLMKGKVIGTSEDVFSWFHDRLIDRRKEGFFCITLTQKHRIIDCHSISEGSLSSTLVHPREAFIPAIRDSAAAVIYCHNHPSGDTSPSVEDKTLTSRLVSCGEILGVRVLDHIVIGNNGFYSFNDHGLIDKALADSSNPNNKSYIASSPSMSLTTTSGKPKSRKPVRVSGEKPLTTATRTPGVRKRIPKS